MPWMWTIGLHREAGAWLVSLNDIAEIRRQLGLTQVQLAATTGLSQACISQIENGRSVSVEVLRTSVGGLGGQVDVAARIGDIRLNVA